MTSFNARFTGSIIKTFALIFVFIIKQLYRYIGNAITINEFFKVKKNGAYLGNSTGVIAMNVEYVTSLRQLNIKKKIIIIRK